MRKIAYILSCTILVFTTPSCYHKLQNDYLEYIPYSGNEILIFQSDLNRMDTIFLTGINEYDISGKTLRTYQAISVNYVRTTLDYNRYFSQNQLIKIMATKKGESRISFYEALKEASFCNIGSYGLSDFENMPDSELTIGDKTYKDVKVFEADEDAKYYESRDNYVERFYWSFSEGFLGLDKKDEKWRLIKKM